MNNKNELNLVWLAYSVSVFLTFLTSCGFALFPCISYVHLQTQCMQYVGLYVKHHRHHHGSSSPPAFIHAYWFNLVHEQSDLQYVNTETWNGKRSIIGRALYFNSWKITRDSKTIRLFYCYNFMLWKKKKSDSVDNPLFWY